MQLISGILFILELAGTAAFALSGALIGIGKEFDIFGVVVLGCTTATGGGIIRDLLLGLTPPAMFENPVYAALACGVSILTFIAAYIAVRNQSFHPDREKKLNRAIDMVDAVGLGVFAVSGVKTAIAAGFGNNGFLCVFIGVITSAGGGALRDVLAGNVPFIFVRRVYAIAALAGALLYYELYRARADETFAMLAGAVLIIIIRILAMSFKWNMPRVRHDSSIAPGENK